MSYLGEYPAGAAPAAMKRDGSLTWAARGDPDGVARYRLAFSVGAAMTTIGLVLTAFSTSLADLLLWRSITAVGYGIVYVTTQAYITVFVSTKEGTQGRAMFLASFFTGSLSGLRSAGFWSTGSDSR